MGDLIRFALYNPGMLSDEEFLAAFVARQNLTESLLRDLLEMNSSGPAKHFLILGQRGMGKTSLLRRLALGVAEDPELSARFLPLSFREEQYNVLNLHVFWCNCLDAFGDFLERAGRSAEASALDDAIAKVAGTRDDPEGNAAFDLFRTWTKREKKRPLLFLDNLDLILAGLEKQQWPLRRALQGRGSLAIVGAAVGFLEATARTDAPFYDFFRVTVLEKLTHPELIACLRRFALERGKGGEKVLRILQGDPARIHTLYDLTGGNPRTLVLLYLLLEMGSEGEIMSDLERLLDQVSALYKARVEDLPPQARAVLDAIALAWNPVTAAGVAVRTGLETTTVSAQIDRMHKLGIVEKTSLSTPSPLGFQIGERLFNIWYLMRHAPRRQRARLRWLTEFLRAFYSPQELAEKAKELMECGNVGNLSRGNFTLAMCEAVEDRGLQYLLNHRATAEFEAYADSIHASPESLVHPSDLHDATHQMAELKRRVKSTRRDWGETTPEEVWELLGGNRSLSNAVKKTKADALENLNPEELNALVNDLRIEAEWVKASFGFPDSIERVRIAVRDGLLESWSDLEHAIPYAHQKGDPGILLIVGGRPSDETKLSQEARRELSEILASVDLSRFEDFLNPTTRQNLAGLLAIAGLNPEAEFAYRRAIELDPEDNWNRIFLADFLANRIGNADAAESVLREARKGNITTPWVFLDLAKLLEKLGRPTEEIEGALQSAIQADPTYSWSWFKFGNFLGGLDGREGEAEQAIRKAIELEPDEAFYWVELCRILDTKMGRLEEALSALRKASALAPGKAYIWHVLGSLLFNRIGDFQEAEKAYRKALELDPRSISTWIQLGDLLRDFLKQPEEAESSYRKALELQPQHTFALANLAYLLLDVSERSDDAEIAFSEAQAAILPKGAALLRAYRAFGRDNFGEACQALLEALGSESLDLLTTFRDDLLRVLRKARESGYGEKLLAWFDGSGMGDRYWPVRAAFDAYLHGEEKLRDVNPEVRGVAAQLLASLNRISIPRASEGSAPGTGRRRGKGIATPRLKTSGEAPTISPRLRKAPKSPTRSGK